MKKHLFLHLSFMGLMGLSTIAYGGWTKYGPNFKSGDPIPNGDCLEMMCQYGCVENDEGEGHCCSNEGKPGNSCTLDICCTSGACINAKCGCEKDADCEGIFKCDQESHACICPQDSTGHYGTMSMTNKTVCCFNKYAWDVSTKTYSLINPDACGCPSGTTEYSPTSTTKACCADETHVLIDIETSAGKFCCPKGTSKWDGKKCVECLVDTDCGKGRTCLASKICSCEKGVDEYIKEDGMTACCPKETPTWDTEQQKCVECLQKSDCQNGQECLADKSCGCPEGIEERTNANGTKGCCTIDRPKWDGKKCVGCVSDADCLGGRICQGSTCVCPKKDPKTPIWDSEQQRCVECRIDSDCTNLGILFNGVCQNNICVCTNRFIKENGGCMPRMCNSYKDCFSDEFCNSLCHFNGGEREKWYGYCKLDHGGQTIKEKNGKSYYVSPDGGHYMSYFGAQDWCTKHGKKLAPYEMMNSYTMSTDEESYAFCAVIVNQRAQRSNIPEGSYWLNTGNRGLANDPVFHIGRGWSCKMFAGTGCSEGFKAICSN